MRDIKYIIKRIIIGTGIALAVMFMKQNVLAYEWEYEGDERVTYSSNSLVAQSIVIKGTSSSSPSYPFSPSYEQNSILNGSFGNISHKDQGYFVNSFNVSFGYPDLEPGDYYFVLPGGYSSTYFSGDDTVNTDYVTNKDNYYSFNPGAEIFSVLFSRGSTNEMESNSFYPEMMYFKVYFRVTDNYDNTIPLRFNLGKPLEAQNTFIFTSYGVTSNTNYLYRFNNTCTSWGSSGNCGRWYNHFYNPLLYSTPMSENYPDGNDLVEQGSSDIKTQIDEIINGQFTEDLEFPYMNGGGKTFGDNTYSFTDLLIMPIDFFRSIVNNSDTCSPVSVPVPGLTGTMQLPCLTTFASSILGTSLVDTIKMIFGCIIGFKILQRLYKDVIHILDPENMEQLQDIF